MAALGAPCVAYGKAAIVGSQGAAEHGAALLHPRLGKPVRAVIGGGQALMPSNVKVGAVGAPVDLPLGHKDEPWSFDHIDTLTVAVPDAPRHDEIVVCVGLSDGTRIRARRKEARLTRRRIVRSEAGSRCTAKLVTAQGHERLPMLSEGCPLRRGADSGAQLLGRV